MEDANPGGVSGTLGGEVLSALDAGSPLGGSNFEPWAVPPLFSLGFAPHRSLGEASAPPRSLLWFGEIQWIDICLEEGPVLENQYTVPPIPDLHTRKDLLQLLQSHG